MPVNSPIDKTWLSTSIPRRTLCGLALGVLVTASALGAERWAAFETSLTSARNYENPFVDVEVDVVFRQGEEQWKVPAFRAGDRKWTVRFAPPTQGDYAYRVECTGKANPGLNGKEQTLSVGACTGKNPLLKHGFLRVAEDKRHFEHADGTCPRATRQMTTSPKAAAGRYLKEDRQT